MKKFVLLLCCLICIFCVAGCEEEPSPNKDKENQFNNNIMQNTVDINAGNSGFVHYDHALMGWPTSADTSWDRFYSYGGSFYIDKWNSWVCNIGGAAITWDGYKWVYYSKSGDCFFQYKDTDYFHIDTSDPLYSFYMSSPTGWVQVSSKGILTCEEPQVFRDDAVALEESVHQINRDNRINTFTSMGFHCYEENGVWKCDTKAGILTYDKNTNAWYGTVDIFNSLDKTWEYNVEIMVDTTLLADHLFRYADGRYDKGVGSLDSDTDYYSGYTYNIYNYGIPGSDYYENNELKVGGKSLTDEQTGISGFVGFHIYEYNYPVSIGIEESTISLTVNESKSITLFKQFETDFDLLCDYDDTITSVTWGKWEPGYLVPRIELTVTAVAPGATTIKIYSEQYPDLIHMIEIVVEENKDEDEETNENIDENTDEYIDEDVYEEKLPDPSHPLQVSSTEIIVKGMESFVVSSKLPYSATIVVEWDSDAVMVFLDEFKTYNLETGQLEGHLEVRILGVKEGLTSLKLFVEEDPSIYQIVMVNVISVPAG